MIFSTCDLCDANEDKLAEGLLQVLPPLFHSFGQQSCFSGQAATLKVFEDNAMVRALLETPGQGRVLVTDGGGSLRCALVGGNLGKLAEENGWSGVVVFGCVRDQEELRQCHVGIRALGVHPQRSQRKGRGDLDVMVTIAGIQVHPGDWIYADADGILVSRAALM